MKERMNERTYKQTKERANERMDEWTNERTNERMDEWTNERTNERALAIFDAPVALRLSGLTSDCFHHYCYNNRHRGFGKSGW